MHFRIWLPDNRTYLAHSYNTPSITKHTTSINNQINDKCTIKPNVIFDTLIQIDTKRVQSAST